MAVRCTEQGHEASPVYLSGHLRVLICFRLAASKEESIETVRQGSKALLKRRGADGKTKEGERGSRQRGRASRGVRREK